MKDKPLAPDPPLTFAGPHPPNGTPVPLLVIPALLGIFSLLSGCALMDIKQQTEAAAGAAHLEGRASTGEQGTLRVVLSAAGPEGIRVVNLADLEGEGSFAFDLLPGTYLLSAYVDSNGDGRYQASEPAAVHSVSGGTAEPLVLAADDRVSVPEIRVTGPLARHDALDGPEDLPLSIRNIGRVVALNDPLFSRENASLGMWRPMDYLADVGGGLFLLEAYDPARIPVVFVHGINGTARDFEAVLASLDRTRYQPWVFQYPSGLELDILGDYFLRAMNTLHERQGFSRAVVVAHSMGGVIMRSVVLKYAAEPTPWKLSLVITVNSPMLGMPSAAAGVRHSPIVVPAWQDLDPDSEFLERLHTETWPADVPYRLVFSYVRGEGDDGVVSLDRQLSQSLQAEALAIHGFTNTHVGTLSDPAFLEQLGVWLEPAVDEPGR